MKEIYSINKSKWSNKKKFNYLTGKQEKTNQAISKKESNRKHIIKW